MYLSMYVRLHVATAFSTVTKHNFFHVNVCVSVPNKAALLHKPISKGMCECLCARTEPQGGLTQAEDPVKCVIFRCVKLLHFFSLSLLGLPSAQPIWTEADKEKYSNTIWMSVTPPAAPRQICKWGKIRVDERSIMRPIACKRLAIKNGHCEWNDPYSVPKVVGCVSLSLWCNRLEIMQ